MKESVLFICDDHSVLGQMAEAFLRRYGWSDFKVYSAGIQPRPIHPYTFRVMEEIGYDLYGYCAKSIFEFNHLQQVDYLITLSDYVRDYFTFNQNAIGCHLHWSFENPGNETGERTERKIAVEIPVVRCVLLRSNSGAESLQGWQVTPASNPILYARVQEMKPRDTRDILARFRSIRDQMECQVMNWLNEKGIGPLWWRRTT